MTEQQQLQAAEAVLAAGLAQYVRAVVAIRDSELLIKLRKKFSDPHVQRQMRELLRDGE